jgi:hypothetical protein
MGVSHVSLDLDRLVREYWENLNVTLRGFHPAEEFDFLQSWVPSDDPTESVLDLVELASAGGLDRLTIEVEEPTAARLAADRIGPCRRDTRDGKTVLEFTLASETELAIHPCYRDSLRRVLAEVRHERPLTGVNGQEPVSVSAQGVTLTALIQAARRAVAQAGFGGAANPVQRGLMEALCVEIEGRPLQEAADHALIAVESRLRDRSQPPPVPGLVTPDNADPAFALPQQLVRALLAEYRARTGWNDTANFYDTPVRSPWARLSEAERSDALCRQLETPSFAGKLELAGMDGPKRVVVRFVGDMPSDARQQMLCQLEEQLRQHVEPTLHVTAQAKSDINILRQPEKKKTPGPAAGPES